MYFHTNTFFGRFLRWYFNRNNSFGNKNRGIQNQFIDILGTDYTEIHGRNSLRRFITKKTVIFRVIRA